MPPFSGQRNRIGLRIRIKPKTEESMGDFILITKKKKFQAIML